MLTRGHQKKLHHGPGSDPAVFSGEKYTNKCNVLLHNSQGEGLQRNYEKTQVIMVAERPEVYKWSINGHKIEQTRAFKVA